ncbi:MAG: UbiH/UbiF/VisC/COQ6 family ubiquinone biosynthesis hydroxylase [Alphaproteobacteria bacterium]|nr:UbiH/UbiF/VisC/COQ6 family ubiquinone biosynthesis hydroxylase [Alphaproteobacteria bacterium]
MKKHATCDVLIIGGGLAGLTLAGLLGRAGVQVVVIDKAPPLSQTTTQYDARATAVSWATHQVLKAAGVWDRLKDHAAPLRDIRVADGGSPLFLHFDADDNDNNAPFGWNLENALFRRALQDNAAELRDTVTHIAPAEIQEFFHTSAHAGVKLADGRSFHAPLLVGADGRHSAVRSFLNIESTQKEYKQTALVCTIAHDTDHESVAVEHFFEDGPFALLPLPDGEDGRFRSSVIWSMPHAAAQRILKQPATDIDAMLQKRCDPHLKGVAAVAPPRGYPLGLMHAAQYTGPRMALVADAAHVIHPIAGQGLNLGMRDIALLAESVVDRAGLGLDIGADDMLSHYASIRRTDTRHMTLFTDILNALFSNELETAATLRRTGLGIVNQIPVLKDFFSRHAMGLGGQTGRIIQNGQL